MRQDHERETRNYLSNLSANRRHVSADRMRQLEGYVAEIRTTFWRGNHESDPSLRTEFYVACGLHRFEPGYR